MAGFRSASSFPCWLLLAEASFFLLPYTYLYPSGGDWTYYRGVFMKGDGCLEWL